MKTLLFSLSMIFFLNITALYASEPLTGLKSENRKTIISTDFTTLAPSAPREAGFMEFSFETSWIPWVIIPVAPKEADFEEDQILKSLAPVTPEEADFQEN